MRIKGQIECCERTIDEARISTDSREKMGYLENLARDFDVVFL
jgi:hypothetical protein